MCACGCTGCKSLREQHSPSLPLVSGAAGIAEQQMPLSESPCLAYFYTCTICPRVLFEEKDCRVGSGTCPPSLGCLWVQRSGPFAAFTDPQTKQQPCHSPAPTASVENKKETFQRLQSPSPFWLLPCLLSRALVVPFTKPQDSLGLGQREGQGAVCACFQEGLSVLALFPAFLSLLFQSAFALELTHPKETEKANILHSRVLGQQLLDRGRSTSFLSG